MRHLLELNDVSRDQILEILAIGKELKRELRNGSRRPIFAGLVLGLLFEKPSLRTRVSFESLISQHQGRSLYLGADVGWRQREPIRDFIPVLTSYLDFLVIRANSHADVVEATKFSKCPIINGLTNESHPCQALADLMTVDELLGGLTSARIAYLGDANNVARSLAIICSKVGVSLTIACPPAYQFSVAFINTLNAGTQSPLIRQTSDPIEAVHRANIVYTDVWTSMGQESEQASRSRDFAPYQVSRVVMQSAAPEVQFLHCLPARRGEEVEAEVIDGPASQIVLQAENRLHAQKGMLAWLLDQRS